jgi:hypothetical protein
MKIVKLDKEVIPKVTIELSLREMNAMRDMLNRSVAIDEKHGFFINRFTKALVWEFNCIRNIASNGMIGPGDALDWVDKLAEKVEDADSKAKTEAKVAESARAAGFNKFQINPETGEVSRSECLNLELPKRELLNHAKRVLNPEPPEREPAPGSFREALQPCPFCEVKNA